jgi:hypothetical protein
MNTEKEPRPTPDQIIQRVKDEVAKEWIVTGQERIFRNMDDFIYCCHNNLPEMNEMLSRVALRFHTEMIKSLAPTDDEIVEEVANASLTLNGQHIAIHFMKIMRNKFISK